MSLEDIPLDNSILLRRIDLMCAQRLTDSCNHTAVMHMYLSSRGPVDYSDPVDRRAYSFAQDLTFAVYDNSQISLKILSANIKADETFEGAVLVYPSNQNIVNNQLLLDWIYMENENQGTHVLKLSFKSHNLDDLAYSIECITGLPRIDYTPLGREGVITVLDFLEIFR